MAKELQDLLKEILVFLRTESADRELVFVQKYQLLFVDTLPRMAAVKKGNIYLNKSRTSDGFPIVYTLINPFGDIVKTNNVIMAADLSPRFREDISIESAEKKDLLAAILKIISSRRHVFEYSQSMLVNAFYLLNPLGLDIVISPGVQEEGIVLIVKAASAVSDLSPGELDSYSKEVQDNIGFIRDELDRIRRNEMYQDSLQNAPLMYVERRCQISISNVLSSARNVQIILQENPLKQNQVKDILYNKTVVLVRSMVPKSYFLYFASERNNDIRKPACLSITPRDSSYCSQILGLPNEFDYFSLLGGLMPGEIPRTSKRWQQLIKLIVYHGGLAPRSVSPEPDANAGLVPGSVVSTASLPDSPSSVCLPGTFFSPKKEPDIGLYLGFFEGYIKTRNTIPPKEEFLQSMKTYKFQPQQQLVILQQMYAFYIDFCSSNTSRDLSLEQSDQSLADSSSLSILFSENILEESRDSAVGVQDMSLSSSPSNQQRDDINCLVALYYVAAINNIADQNVRSVIQAHLDFPEDAPCLIRRNEGCLAELEKLLRDDIQQFRTPRASASS